MESLLRVFLVLSIGYTGAIITLKSQWRFRKFTHLLSNAVVFNEDSILRRIDTWACIKNCGACCKLGPIESRPDLSQYLTAEELDQYKALIGSDDWCVNFNKETRKCSVYETRPSFCTVDPKKYKVMFDVEEDEFTDFCAFCCREQITDVYGEESKEMDVFENVQLDLLEKYGDQKEGGEGEDDDYEEEEDDSNITYIDVQ